MRKVVVAAFVSVDGVMQAPGGPEEDPTGGFRYGGWTVPHWDDEVVGRFVGEAFAEPFDLLLGRRTYDIFASHWPFVVRDPSASGFDPGDAAIAERFDAVTKHVATHRPKELGWKNSRPLGPDVVRAVRELVQGDGPTLLTQGSSELVHLLLEHDLVDELRLVVYPVVLGRGKRLFSPGSAPRELRLTDSAVSPAGTLVATYQRGGEVRTGSFASHTPSPAELERRAALGRR